MEIPLKSGKTLEKQRWRGCSNFCNGKSFSSKLSYFGYFSPLILVVYLILDTMHLYLTDWADKVIEDQLNVIGNQLNVIGNQSNQSNIIDYQLN